MVEITRDRLSGHPHTEALLSYLDSDSTSEERSHIAHCAHCQAELEHIQSLRQAMRELPLQQPPPRLWQNIRNEIPQIQQQKSVFSWRSTRWLSIAASFLLVAMVALIGLPKQELTADPVLAQLIEENRQLEAALARLETQSPVLRLDTIGQITLLKDSVLAVDMAFDRQTYRPSSETAKVDLLEKRIGLMRELVEKRAQPVLAYSNDYHTF